MCPPPIFESQLGSVISQLFSAISFVTIPLVKLTHIFNIVLRDFFIWPSPPSIDGNNFGGTLPKEMVSLEVNRFHISNNITIGSIPGAFSVIVSLLQHVNIYFHKLTGTIPIFWTSSQNWMISLLVWITWMEPLHTFSNLHQSLKYFTVCFSLLCGTILLNFDTMTSLWEISIWGNLLSGTIPSSMGCFLSASPIFLRDNSNINGTIPSYLGNSLQLGILGL